MTQIGDFVKFRSFREGFEGVTLGQIINISLANSIKIRRIHPKDTVEYHRTIGESGVEIISMGEALLFKLEE